jgi:hypothetical protein
MLSADSGSRDPKDLSGLWWGGGPAVLKPAGDSSMQLTAAGKEMFGRTQAETRAVAAGPKNKSDLSRCLPFGVPRIWTQPFPLEIIQSPELDLVTIVYEHNAVFRLVPLNVPLPNPDDVDPAYMGHSVGRWVGDELVIETAYFNDSTVLDDDGLPHSANLHVTERIRKQKEGNALHVAIRVDDPAVFTRPWTTDLVLRRAPKGTKLQEYICGWGEFTNRHLHASNGAAGTN